MPTYYRRTGAAKYLQDNYRFSSENSLATQASNGGGPRFRYNGRYPIYEEGDLDEYALSRLSEPVSSTSDHPNYVKRHAGPGRSGFGLRGLLGSCKISLSACSDSQHLQRPAPSHLSKKAPSLQGIGPADVARSRRCRVSVAADSHKTAPIFQTT
jgi:hypothetical protein